MTIGERIRNRRKELGLTQEELGKRLGVTRSSICKVETDKEQNLTLDRVTEYAKALNCTESDLMGWSSIPFSVGEGEVNVFPDSILLKFHSNTDKSYYEKMKQILSDPMKRKIIGKFVDSLFDD